MRTRLALLAIAAVPSLALAQVRPSEHATLSQVVSGTTLTMEFDRPTARGRTLFGDAGATPRPVVHWGEVWTPGANWATTFASDKPVRIDGQTLPAGKYTVWVTPAKSGDWTLAFSRIARRYHFMPPPDSSVQMRIGVRPEQGAHMETLAWYFPVVNPDGATLRMHWGTTVLPIHIGVDLPALITLAGEERATYVGTYQAHFTFIGEPPMDAKLEVHEVNGALRIRSIPDSVFGGDLALVPSGQGRFHAAYPGTGEYKGRPFVEPDMAIVFDVANGTVTRIRMLESSGEVGAEGRPVKP